MSEALPRTEAAPPRPVAAAARGRWMVDPGVTFLNHGSFGARLREVFDAQVAWRERFERQPVEMLDRGRHELIDAAKTVVGAFLGMTPEDFGFTSNATDGVNAVLRSLRFGPGDEVLTTNHVYNAVRRTLEHLAHRSGATAIEVPVPFPVAAPGEVLDAIDGAITERTRLVIVDHVTSPTALRFPLEAIVERCRTRGVDVLVDGAHAPGMIDLDVESLGVAYYAGNLHKWVGAPPGAGFLWVRRDKQPGIHPTVISHFLNEGLPAEFAWQGTRDISPWLAARDAIEQMSELDGPDSWPRIMRHNHELAVFVQHRLGHAWAVDAGSPADGSMLGSMVSLPLPERVCAGYDTPEAFQAGLYARHRIEVPLFDWGGRWLIRPCCQVYNTPDQYERLGDAIVAMG